MKKDHSSQPGLKGTLISVFAVGIVIILMWVSIFYLYIDRM
ncbi:cytochrome C oxidase subunit II [Halobacillus mangrovi]|uniref:Cytochrome C oxidase subunit II n=1 Tax=Halobacillus mangrovi TaxID=402384 RepID=A0A1W5ZR66_9BACI|nr:cytochrome C oxidase subunit II [Halobacillus mangrovi]ARI75790.1 cytochrome C oxidase subunit II [Halobacillus mangrovi]